jgi:UDP-2-acetamido-3-amino-2,3-dideoxy-glucuronate N-acetyltransferase
VSERVAVVGFGAWGRNLVRNFADLGALGVICDSDPKLAALASDMHPGVPFRSDLSAVLADDSITAVAISTPASTHYPLARLVLEHGKDVFVEKPLALSTNEGEELVEAAEANGLILMVGHVLRYHPAVAKLEELVAQNDLGEIRYAYSNRLNIGKIRSEENILWSFAPHDISVIIALLGSEPTSLSCRGAAYLNSDVADVTLSEFEFSESVRAHVFVSWLHPFKEQRLVVVGTEKMAVFDDTDEQKLVLYPHRVEWSEQTPIAVRAEGQVVEISAAEPLRLECEHFLDCIETRRRPLTDGIEGLQVLRVLDRLQRSLEENLGNHRPFTANMGSVDPTTTERSYFAHPTAIVDDGCQIGNGTRVWHFSHLMGGAKIGRDCTIGQGCFVASDVTVGDGVRVQNNVSIYDGTTIEDYVFLGPSCVLTNVSNPRAEINRRGLYEPTVLRRGCTLGANATVLTGVAVGRYAFVAAGAVVTGDVEDYAMMVGAPARRVGWMSRHGLPLRDPDHEGVYTCLESGWRYQQDEDGGLRCLDFGEDQPLPDVMRVGEHRYHTFRSADRGDGPENSR